MSYQDLDLRIIATTAGELRVALDSPAGQAADRFELGWRADQLADLLEELGPGSARDLDPPERSPQRRAPTPTELGAALFAALFPAPVRSLLDQSLGTDDAAPALRLRLRLDAGDRGLAWLQGVPWELLYRATTRDFLALSRDTTIVRWLEVPRASESPPLPRPLRILALTSAADTHGLDLERERRDLERAWANLPGVELYFLAATGLDGLRNALLERDFHVLHFMGHGGFDDDAGEGTLLFGSGSTRVRVSGERLATALRDFASLRLVVLNACKSAQNGLRTGDPAFSGVASALVLGRIEAVIAMQLAISDGAAIAFSRALYTRLAAGDPIEAAVVEGRQAIHNSFTGSLEWATPVLFSRCENGRLFEPPAERDDALLARYLDWLAERYGELELPSLPGEQRRPRLPLAAVFVALRADFSSPWERAVSRERLEEEARRLENLLAVEELTSEQRYRLIWRQLRLLARDPSPWELDERTAAAITAGPTEPAISLAELVRTRRRLVFLGDPGSGKSTLLRWLAVRLAGARRRGEARLCAPAWQLEPEAESDAESDLGPVRVPILLRVASFAQARREQPDLRLVEMIGHLGPRWGIATSDARGTPLDPAQLNRLLREHLERGEAAVLLDGLDEIADPADRLEIAREIDAFLDTWVPEDGSNLAVVTSRIVGYHLAGLTATATHLTLEPMGPRAAERFCKIWTDALQRPENETAELAAALAELRRRGAGELAGNPLLITVIALLFVHGRRALPARRIELYELAVRVLLERWRERGDRCADPEERAVLELLVPLAAEIHRFSSLGTIGESELARVLERHLPTAQVMPFRRAVRGQVGLLVERGEGVYGFLHLAFQEYLAARWLIAEREPLARIGEHLADPRWREPVVMALGLLTETAENEPLETLLLRFLRTDDPLGRHVPRTTLLLAAALPEMVTCPEPVITETALRLLCAYGTEAPQALSRLVEQAFRRLLAGAHAGLARRVLVRALHLPEAADAAGSAARLIAALGLAAPELAEALAEARPRDAEPYPIERALCQIAARDPGLIPAARSSLRRTLGRKPELAARFLANPAWRRIGILVYGGLTREGGFALERCWREIPELTAPVLGALERESSPADLAAELRALATPEAMIALLALGEPPVELSGERAQHLCSSLERLAAMLAEVPVDLEPLAGPLRRLGETWSAERWLELVNALLEQLAPAERQVDAVLELAELAPAAARPALLAEAWRLLLTPTLGSWHDLAYNLAVTLDVAGAQLAEMPLRAETLAAIPPELDFVRDWALAVLEPSPEPPPGDESPRPGPILLEHTDALLAAAKGEQEPLLGALTLLGARAVVRDALAVLAPAAAQPMPHVELATEHLPALLAALEAEDDLARCQAALTLGGDGAPIGRRRSVRRLGTPMLLELARAWLDRHEEAPRSAVVIRWAFETFEHDDPDVLRELIALTEAANADEAEMVLGDLHAVRAEVWPVLVEALGEGPPKARRALLRSVCTLLARRRLPEARWADVAPLLSALGEVMGADRLVLGGPEAIVDAVLRGVAPAATSWREVLGGEPAAVRLALREIGERRLEGARTQTAFEHAADRLAASPERFEPLLEWLDRELTNDVQGRHRDDHLRRDLIRLAAGVARRLPNTYVAKLERLPVLERKLAEAAEYGDWFPARQAALELLSLTRRASRHALTALRSGLLDVAEVQQTALRSVARYRELDPALLPELERGFEAASPARAFATARLIAALARNNHFEPSLRARFEQALAAAIDPASARRAVHVLVEQPLGKHDRQRRIEHLGNLATLLRGLVLDVTGLGDLFHRTESGGPPEKS